MKSNYGKLYLDISLTCVCLFTGCNQRLASDSVEISIQKFETDLASHVSVKLDSNLYVYKKEVIIQALFKDSIELNGNCCMIGEIDTTYSVDWYQPVDSLKVVSHGAYYKGDWLKAYYRFFYSK